MCFNGYNADRPVEVFLVKAIKQIGGLEPLAMEANGGLFIGKAKTKKLTL